MKFIDSHCHLDLIDLKNFNDSFEHLIQQTKNAGIEQMLCVSLNLKSYPEMLQQVEKHPQILVSVGKHPLSDEKDGFSVQQLLNLAKNKKVVAIGETGLDYYYQKDQQQLQQQRFRAHIQVAREVNKPLIVHTRDATNDTLSILKEEKAEQCGGVIHCFTESQAFADKAMEMGFMISFSGIITFKSAIALQEVAKTIPDDYLLIETDSPYLAPHPYRGKVNQPAYVRHIAEKLATLRESSVGHIATITNNNYYSLFNLTN